MSIQEFRSHLIQRLEPRLEQGFQVSFHPAMKNNGIPSEGIVIKEKNILTAPVIPLDRFYERFQKGVSLEHLADLLLQEVEEFKKDALLQNPMQCSYERIKDKIYCKLISRKRNETLLYEVPFEKWQDLAVVCYYQSDQPFLEDIRVMIRKEYLKAWKMPEEQLWKDAWANSIRKYPADISRLSDLLAECPEEVENKEDVENTFDRSGREIEHTDKTDKTEYSLNEVREREPDDRGLYVITNAKRTLGAICICYPSEMERLAMRIGTGFFILPSSIHECLILPDNGQYNQAELDRMIRQINRDQLAPEEILSDHSYYYSIDKGDFE